MTDPLPSQIRSSALLAANRSRLLIVDLQERLLPSMSDGEAVVENCVKLIRAAEIFDVPVSATEQYPRGLGPSVGAIAERIATRPEKLSFSCLPVLDWANSADRSFERHQIVIAGIETHICVLQTALDLQACGYDVAVVVDAVTSRAEMDYDMAMARMSDAGVQLVTFEMVLFEWCEAAGTEQFRRMRELIAEND